MLSGAVLISTLRVNYIYMTWTQSYFDAIHEKKTLMVFADNEDLSQISASIAHSQKPT